MGFAIQWHCQQGTRTIDNRDHAGVGVRGASVLAIVLDGSSSGPASGVFARAIAERLVDWYVTTSIDITAATITQQLREIQSALLADFRRDSASYVLFHAGLAPQVSVLHAGDCLLGHRGQDGQISWLTQPHTLANALSAVPHDVLATLNERHVLTRSFRSRTFLAPDVTMIDLQDQMLFVGTDGFWADLDKNAQLVFAQGQFPGDAAERDDRGLLSVSRRDAGTSTKISGIHAAESIYVRYV